MNKLIIFAKAPWPGFVKTRLIPLLGAHGAALAHKSLVKQTLTTAALIPSTRIELHYNAPHPFFTALARRYKLTLERQAEGDLGDKITYALQKQSNKTLLIGADCIGIDHTHIKESLNALNNYDMVFLPAEDGGYGLVGVNNGKLKYLNKIFENITWGSDKVMSETRAKLKEFDISYREPNIIWDVDTPEDYQRWQASNQQQLNR